MSDLKHKQLLQAEHLINKEQFDEAFQFLNTLEKKEVLTCKDLLACRLLKCMVLNSQGHFDQALNLGKLLYQESQEYGIPVHIFDALYVIAEALFRLGEFDKALEKIENCEEILSLFVQKASMEITRREVDLFNRKGTIYIHKGNFDPALECLKKSLTLGEQLGDKRHIAPCLNNIGVIYSLKGELDQSLEYYLRFLTINRKLGNKRNLASSLHNIGYIYRQKGELNRALEYFEESLPLFEEGGNKQSIALSLSNLSMVYHSKGELERALEYSQRSLILREELGNNQDIAQALHRLGTICTQKGAWEQALDYLQRGLVLHEEIGNNLYTTETLLKLVVVSLEKSSLNQAQQYLQKLKSINKIEENKIISQRYRLARALCLKAKCQPVDELSSTTLHNILTHFVTAQAMLREIIDEEIVEHEVTIEAIFNLCELLITDLQSFRTEAALIEVNQLTKRLLEIGQTQKLYPLLAKTYLLMSKLALLELNIERARELLNQAYKIAEEKGFRLMIITIQSEQKHLAEYTNLSQEASTYERLTNIHLDGLLAALRHNRVDNFVLRVKQIQTLSRQELKSLDDELGKQEIKGGSPS